MLGKDLYKLENSPELSNDSYKSLVLFYRPLIGNDALVLYLFLINNGISHEYKELNSLLARLNVSADKFEEDVALLNKYKLVNTLKAVNEEKYIFVLKKPLSTASFVKDSIFVRNFILKAGGDYYQEILSSLEISESRHEGFTDISRKFDLSVLEPWNREYEDRLIEAGKKSEREVTYNTGTLFDINHFLKGVSNNLFPLKYRTYENLLEIAKLADLYDISYDRMRTYLPKVLRSDSDGFDIKLLRYLCLNSKSEYHKVEEGRYDVPVVSFLMNLQGGREVTEYDRKLIAKLSNSYKLPAEVINVLLEKTLKSCDNRLLESYCLPLASDLHRNDVKTAEAAIERLDRFRTKNTPVKENRQVYDDSDNIKEDLSSLEEFLQTRNSNG